MRPSIIATAAAFVLGLGIMACSSDRRVSNNDAGGGLAGAAGRTCTTGESGCFSFFVTSRARLFALAEAFNGSTSGWGGDLRYGTGDGLTGADKICAAIAESSLPENGKTWRAFLSTSTVNAVDRVGTGPWYDRLNRLIAGNLTELIQSRPGGIVDTTILNNLPNEDGTPHHNEEAGCSNLNSCADNHDILTGSDAEGRLCTPSTCSGMGIGVPSMDGGIPDRAMRFGALADGGMPFMRDGGDGTNVTDWTCSDWTSAVKTPGSQPRVGHTWSTIGGSDNWISTLNEGGCLPGYNLAQTGAADPNVGTVGSGGGYGGIYCLATSPW